MKVSADSCSSAFNNCAMRPIVTYLESRKARPLARFFVLDKVNRTQVDPASGIGLNLAAYRIP
jgi:hypothetical protein